MTTWEVNVYVVVFPAYRLLNKWFAHDLSVDDYRVPVFTQGDFWGNLEAAQREADMLLHKNTKLFINLGPTVARGLQTTRSRNTKMVQNGADQSAIP